MFAWAGLVAAGFGSNKNTAVAYRMRANYGSWASVFHLLTSALCCFGCFPTQSPPEPAAGNNNRPRLKSVHSAPMDVYDYGNLTSTEAPSNRLPCTTDEARTTKCLNGGKCFAVLIKDQRHIACHCPEGYTNRRCEEKVIPAQEGLNTASVLIWVFGVLAIVIVVLSIIFFIWYKFCRAGHSSSHRSVPHKQEYDHAKQVEEARKYELQLSGGQLTYASPPPPRDDESGNFEHLDMQEDGLPDQYEKIVGGPIVTPISGMNGHNKDGRHQALANGRVTDV